MVHPSEDHGHAPSGLGARAGDQPHQVARGCQVLRDGGRGEALPLSRASEPSAAFAFGDWQGLTASFVRAARESPFVAAQLERSGLSAEQAVANPPAWSRLRPTRKHDLIADQDGAPPYGSRRCVPAPEISLVVESSGSTGKGREVHYLSRDDLGRSSRAWARYLEEMGIGAEDVVALTFPIGMAGGGVRHWYAYVETGAKVLRVGGLSSERKLDAIRYYGATTLVATPAYVDRLAVICAESGCPPGELGIRRLVVATQSLSAEWIEETERLWGAKLFEWYGTSAGIAAFCCRLGMAADGRRGTLHWNPAVAAQEVVDPRSGDPVADGQRGELLGTPLINEAEPLFRVSTGDEVRFVAPRSCPCGSNWPGIESGTVRRLDAMFKVKGINVWPAQVEATLLEDREVLDYRVRIYQDGGKRERVRLEVLARPGHGDELAERVSRTLQGETGISFEVVANHDRERWSQATAGEAAKASRWVDERIGT
ncbi:MAG: AMP-binding protein [Solirubrobacterales bacterium]|nr:AMP-binding protein [Solirubrobacterales bacterium]